MALENASGPEDDDPLQEAKAYGASIYFMMSMPYLICAVGGVKLYLLAQRTPHIDGLATRGDDSVTATANP